jgi:hypothetical protein
MMTHPCENCPYVIQNVEGGRRENTVYSYDCNKPAGVKCPND